MCIHVYILFPLWCVRVHDMCIHVYILFPLWCVRVHDMCIHVYILFPLWCVRVHDMCTCIHVYMKVHLFTSTGRGAGGLLSISIASLWPLATAVS